MMTESESSRFSETAFLGQHMGTVEKETLIYFSIFRLYNAAIS